MPLAINRIRDLFTAHIALAGHPSVVTALAVTMVASSIWDDYTDRLLKFADDELGKQRVMDAESWSLLLMTSAKAGLERKALSAACMNFTEQLVIESGLDAKSFADIVTPAGDGKELIEQLMNTSMIGFAQACIDGHKEKVKGAN